MALTALDRLKQGFVQQYETLLDQLGSNNNEYKPPHLDTDDASVPDAIRHVALSAEYYYDMSILAGAARAAADLAEGRYKAAFRNKLLTASGSNKEAREAEASSQTEEEYREFLYCSSAATLFALLEKAARTNADSSRKIADLIHSQRITESGHQNYE